VQLCLPIRVFQFLSGDRGVLRFQISTVGDSTGNPNLKTEYVYNNRKTKRYCDEAQICVFIEKIQLVLFMFSVAFFFFLQTITRNAYFSRPTDKTRDSLS
jgi:hypothetical protein